MKLCKSVLLVDLRLKTQTQACAKARAIVFMWNDSMTWQFLCQISERFSFSVKLTSREWFSGVNTSNK